MSYTLRPESSGDTLVSSRDPIRTNFQLIRDQFQQNHVDIQSDGKHKFLQMPEQASAPTTAVDEGGFYTKETTGLDVPDANLYFRRENNGQEMLVTGLLTGSIALGAIATDIETLPPNSWGFVLFQSQSSRTSMATTSFMCTATNLYAISSGFQSSNVVSVQSNPGNLRLAAIATPATYDYKIHYWTQS